MPVGIITVQTYRHTQKHTQMHSDNPSAVAKCCLIQPDLHSTEKANSLPLTVWKTERSSHKWQRFTWPCLCVVYCVCTCVPGGVNKKQPTVYVFVFVIFFQVHVCLHVLVVTSSSAVPPSLCDKQIARLLCSLLFGGWHQTLLVLTVMCVFVAFHLCVGDERVCTFLHFYISAPNLL